MLSAGREKQSLWGALRLLHDMDQVDIQSYPEANSPHFFVGCVCVVAGVKSTTLGTAAAREENTVYILDVVRKENPTGFLFPRGIDALG